MNDEETAKAKHSSRVRQGHRTPDWDNLSDLMKEYLVHQERQARETKYTEHTPNTAIPWNLWVKILCLNCGLTGEGRYRLVAAGHYCPRCEELGILTTQQQVGEPFVLEGSDE